MDDGCSLNWWMVDVEGRARGGSKGCLLYLNDGQDSTLQ